MLGLITLAFILMGLEGGALEPSLLMVCTIYLAAKDIWRFLKRKGVLYND
jgi:hypothetical protein